MKLVKGKMLLRNAVLQKTDKYGKSVEDALQHGDDGLYLVEKDGDHYSLDMVNFIPEQPVIVTKIEEVIKKTFKPKTIKRSFRKK